MKISPPSSPEGRSLSGKKTITLRFAKFWDGFNADKDNLTTLLRQRYNVELTDDAEYLIYSVYPGSLPVGNFTRIFYTPENVRPKFDECDWAIGFDYEDQIKNSRYFRLPNFVRLGGGPDLVKPQVRESIPVAIRKKFCAFVYFQSYDFRERFFKALSRYRHIDSPGRSMNNMRPIGQPDPTASRFSANVWKDKVEFLKDYKFTIAFENESYPGYTTEKIYHAMLAGSIPIYWGNPRIAEDFNPKSFINVRDYWTTSGVIRKIREIDRDDNLYHQYIQQPWFHNNTLPAWANLNCVLSRLSTIFG